MRQQIMAIWHAAGDLVDMIENHSCAQTGYDAACAYVISATKMARGQDTPRSGSLEKEKAATGQRRLEIRTIR